MLDFHMHVWPHGRGTPTPTYDQLARYCEAATAKGIQCIAVTEHSHRFGRIFDEVVPNWRRGDDDAMNSATDAVLAREGGADLDSYVDALVRAKERGLPLLVGLEVDYFDGAAEAMAQVLADYPFDVRLGSVHWLEAWLFDDYFTRVFADRWKHVDVSAVWSSYANHILALAGTGMVDVLAHLDLVKVCGYRPVDIAAHETRLVEGLAELNVAVEVSSAGLRKPAAELYPSASLLDRIVAAGIPLTTASDAHEVGQIGADFDQVHAALAARGVTELVTFDRRDRHPYVLNGPDDH
jgi:histidinol-phosphatase (PHP family)